MIARVPTGHPLLDAVLGGGFPEGLTVIACDNLFAVDAITNLCRPLRFDPPRDTRLELLFHSHDQVDRLRRYALVAGEIYVLVREPREGSRDDLRVADVFLRAQASRSRLVVEAVKNQGRPLAAVRFTTVGCLAEIDTVPSGAVEPGE